MFSDVAVAVVVVVFFKDPGKRGHIVADTLLPVMFLELPKMGNICCGHKLFLNKIRNIFWVPECPQHMLRARANGAGNICVGNNVSATEQQQCQGC